MARRDVGTVYTQDARKDAVGTVLPFDQAYFRMVDGRLQVVTDPALATHSWELFNGRRIIVPYRSDSIMVLGAGGTELGVIRVPASSLLLTYAPGEEWAEFPVALSRGSVGLFTDSLDPAVFVDTLGGSAITESRGSVGLYTASA